jgi:hypothetical protein
MSTIKSSTEHLTLNADGASKDIKFQANGVEVSSISSAGAFTSTSIDATKLSGALPAIDGSALTGMSGGLYSSVAIIADQKATGVQSGTFTTGAWRTRTLNTEISDADGIVSIASSQFILQAGTYTIEWSAPAFRVQEHLTRLYNATDASVEDVGTTEYAEAGTGTSQSRSFGSSVVTIAGAKAFTIEHRSNQTSATFGFGIASDYGSDISYALVKILKHA